jgi:hypothetical protein
MVADVLTAAIAVAALDTEYPDRGIIAIVSCWMSLQNLTAQSFRGLVAYVAARPEPFLDAYESGVLERDDDRFLQLLLHASKREPVARALDARVDRWLGTWSRASQEWGNPSEQSRRRQERNARIDIRLAELNDDERAYFEANCPELGNAGGAARAAVLRIFGTPQAAFARGIVAFAFAHTIAGDHRSPFDEVAWAVRLNRVDHEELSARIREEVAPFAAPGASLRARAAAACALRLLGSLDGQIGAEQLSPTTPLAFSHPSGSVFDPLDPGAEPSQDVMEATTRLQGIDPTTVWTHMSVTSEDDQLNRVSDLLARFDPDCLISFLDSVAGTIASRTGFPLRQLSWRLPWLSPILREGTIEAIPRRIEDVCRDPSLVADQDFVIGMMVEAVLPRLDAGVQLGLLQSLPPEAPFFLRYSALAKPLLAAEAERRLGDALSVHPRILERTLLFLAATDVEMTEGLRDHVISCLNDGRPEVQAAAAEFARRRGDAALDDVVLTLPLPADGDRSWRAATLNGAFASAVARRDRVDSVEQIPIEHLDWVAVRMHVARGRLAETIDTTIDRLARPLLSKEPSDALMVLDVGKDPVEARINLIDRGEKADDPIAAFRAKLGDNSGARHARRRQLLYEQLETFLTSLASENALTVARRPQTMGLVEIARDRTERYAGWLRRILAVEDLSTLRQFQNLGFVLAQNFAGVDPALAARTFAHLWKVEPYVTIRIGRAKHTIRDLALFTAPSSQEMDALRNQAFEEARDDGQIERLVLAAEAAGAGAWLDAFVDARASSVLPADQALALTVASFRPQNTQSSELLVRDWHRGFLGATAEVGRKRYRTAVHAQHWFEQAREAHDPRERWRFLELGIAAADRRQLLKPDASLAPALREFGGDVPERLNKAADKASRDVGKTFFGSKKPTGLMGQPMRS